MAEEANVCEELEISEGHADIPSLLSLESLGNDKFLSLYNEENSSSTLFGGQLVAQALVAADATVEDQTVHSLHGYFCRSGRIDERVEYQVEHVRDGKRISNRRVTATQSGRMLFVMSCSYKTALDGFEHQRPMAIPFEPEKALDLGDIIRQRRADLLASIPQLRNQHVEWRVPEEAGFLRKGGAPRRHYWLRVPASSTVDNPDVHRAILAYLSDFLLPGAPLVPHTDPMPGPHLTVASLDHAIWFHRDVRCDDWLFFDTHSPNARGSVNLTQGYVYNRSGELLATIAQETLQTLL